MKIIDSLKRWYESYTSLEYIEFVFTDSVSGKSICTYRDSEGLFWLKDSRWSLFRVQDPIRTRYKRRT